MKQTTTQSTSGKRIILTLTLSSGVASSILYFLSMGHYPKTSDEQVIEAIALWLSVLFIALTVVYISMAALGKRR